MKNRNGAIRRFFAVTATSSVYHIYAGAMNSCQLVVQKVFCSGKSELAEGAQFKGEDFLILNLEDGILIRKRNRFGIVMGTSPIVALFPEKKAAISAVHHTGLRPADPRWEAQTGRMLKKIGFDHPIFRRTPDGASKMAF